MSTDPAESAIELMGALRDAFERAMEEGLLALSKRVEDRWFRQSEAGGDASVQAEEALRAWRSREAAWRRAIQTQHGLLWHRAIEGANAMVVPSALRLVDDETDERRLAWSAWRERMGQGNEQPLAALSQRWWHLQGRPRDGQEPFAAVSWERLLEQQTAEMSLLPVQEVVLAKVAESTLSGAWQRAVDQGNRLMFQAGILSELGQAGRPLAANAPSEGGADDDTSATETLPSPPPREVWNALKAWLRFHGTDTPDAVPISADRLRDLLSRLDAIQPDGPTAPEAFKDRVREALRTEVGDQAGLGQHEAAIELVSRMFAFFLKDPAIPPVIQVLLARMQIPYVRMAIRRPDVLVVDTSPSKRLLDKLAEIGRQVVDEERSAGLVSAIRKVVDAVASMQEERDEWFAAEVAGLDRLLQSHLRRTNVVERRVRTAQDGQERLADARLQVRDGMVKRLLEWPGEAWVKMFLIRAWGHHLVRVWLQHGESPEWQQAWRFVDHIRLFERPGADRVAEQMARLIQPMMVTLRSGMKAAGWPQETVDHAIATLSAHLSHRLDHTQLPIPPESLLQDLARIPAPVDVDEVKAAEATATTPSIAPAAPVAAPSPLLPPSATMVLSPAPVAPVSRPGSPQETPFPPEWARHVEMAEAVKTGAWVEWVDANAARTNVKLSWVSRLTGRRLFVTATGNRAFEADWPEMVRMVAEHRLYPIDTRSITNRALLAVTSDLAVAAPAAAPAPERSTVQPLWEPLFQREEASS